MPVITQITNGRQWPLFNPLYDERELHLTAAHVMAATVGILLCIKEAFITQLLNM
jgi:hypothetical protein